MAEAAYREVQAKRESLAVIDDLVAGREKSLGTLHAELQTQETVAEAAYREVQAKRESLAVIDDLVAGREKSLGTLYAETQAQETVAEAAYREVQAKRESLAVIDDLVAGREKSLGTLHAELQVQETVAEAAYREVQAKRESLAVIDDLVAGREKSLGTLHAELQVQETVAEAAYREVQAKRESLAVIDDLVAGREKSLGTLHAELQVQETLAEAAYREAQAKRHALAAIDDLVDGREKSLGTLHAELQVQETLAEAAYREAQAKRHALAAIDDLVDGREKSLGTLHAELQVQETLAEAAYREAQAKRHALAAIDDLVDGREKSLGTLHAELQVQETLAEAAYREAQAKRHALAAIDDLVDGREKSLGTLHAELQVQETVAEAAYREAQARREALAAIDDLVEGRDRIRQGLVEPLEEGKEAASELQTAIEQVKAAARGGLELVLRADASQLEAFRDQILSIQDDLGDALDDLVSERYGERLAAALGLDQGINFGPLDDLAGAIGRVREAATDLPIAPLSQFSAEIRAAADSFGTIDTTTWNETADVIRRFGESNWTFTNRLRDFRIQFAQLNEVALGIDPQLWEDAIAPLRDAAWGAGATAAETYRAEIELLSGAYAEAASSETKLRDAIASSVSSGATLGTILEGLAADAVALADGSFTASQGIQDLRNAAAGAIMLDTAPIKEAFSELEASFTRQQTQQDALRATIDGVGDSYLSAYADIAAGASVVTDRLDLIGEDNRELADLTVTEMIALGQQAADTVIQVGDAARTSAEGSVAAIEGAAATIGPILGAGSAAFGGFGAAATAAGASVQTATDGASVAVTLSAAVIETSLVRVGSAFVGVSISAEESGIDVAKAVDEMSDAVYGAGLGMESSLGGASAAFVSVARSAEQAAATINTALESIVTEVDITITTTYVTAYVTVGTPGSGGGVTQVEQDRRIDDTLRGGPIGLAEGGIVTRPTFALLGEDGPEAVIPLDELGSRGEGGGVTVVVNVNGSLLAQDDILAMVERAAARGAALSTRR